MNTTRKTPGQIAFENVQKPLRKPDFIDRQWDEISPQAKAAWEEGAAAVLANQWRSVDDPPGDRDEVVIVADQNTFPTGTNIVRFSGKLDERTHWMPIPPLPQPVDPYESLKKAHAAGKVIQHEYKGSPGTWFDCVIAPQWLQSMNYRIKPWSLSRHLPGFRPLADGEEWHRQDWTEEMLPEGYRPLLLDEMPVEGDEVLFGSTWCPQSKRALTIPASGSQGTCEQRTTRPLPPTKDELDIEAFYTWWTDYKLTAIDRTPNRDTAYAAWKAAKEAVTK